MVVLNGSLILEPQINGICGQARQSLYAVRIMLTHGITGTLINLRCGAGENSGWHAPCHPGRVEVEGGCRATGEEPSAISNGPTDPSEISAR